MTGSELKKFVRSHSVNGAGELTVNAGRYSRAAVVMAFEMIGGIETFAQWAEENPDEFYTKMFGKMIGRETEQTSSDDVEDMLNVLDGECEDITDVDIIEDEVDAVQMGVVNELSDVDIRLSRAAAQYAEAEDMD